MTAWNAQNHISEALESALAQTYRNFEIIVVDDGSTDSTALKVRQVGRGIIQLISLAENHGIPTALNIGLRSCQGKYVARLDADDLCLPNRLEHQVTILEMNPDIGVLGGSALAITDQGETLPPIHVKADANLGCQLLFGNRLKSSTVMIRRSLLEDNAIFFDEDYPNAQDYELWCRLSYISRIANDSTPVSIYRYHRNQQTSQHFERQLRLALRVQANALSQARQTKRCSASTILRARVMYLKHRLLLTRVRLAEAPMPFAKRLAWSNMDSR